MTLFNLGNTTPAPLDVAAIISHALNASEEGVDVHVIGIGNSWMHGLGADRPQSDGFFSSLVRDMKVLGGDRGKYHRFYNPRNMDSLNGFAYDVVYGDNTSSINDCYMPTTFQGFTLDQHAHGFGEDYVSAASKATALARDTVYVCWYASTGADVHLASTDNDHLYRAGVVYCATGAVAPTVGTKVAITCLDGECVWMDEGAAAGDLAWTPNSIITSASARTSGGRKLRLIGGRNSCAGVSGGSEPTWAANNTDGTCYWIRFAIDGTGLPAWAENTNYKYGDQVTAKTPGTTYIYQLIGGKTKATAPTMGVGYNSLTVDGDSVNSYVTWTEWGWSKVRQYLSEGFSYEVIGQQTAAVAGTDTMSVGFLDRAAATVDMSAAAVATWSTPFAVPAFTTIAARTMTLEWLTGTCYLEGIRVTRKATKGGIYDYNLGYSGRKLKDWNDNIAANTRWTEALGRNSTAFLPTADYYLFMIELGYNDVETAVTIADAKSYLGAMITAIKANFATGTYGIIFITGAPLSAMGAPVVGETHYDWFQSLGTQAQLDGAWWIDLTQVFGGLSPAAAKIAGYISVDGSHPSRMGHRVVAGAIEQAMGFDTPNGQVVQDFNTIQKASISTAVTAALSTAISASVVPIGTDVEIIKKVLINDSDKVGGDFPYTETIYDDDGASALESWTYTKNRSTEEKRRA